MKCKLLLILMFLVPVALAQSTYFRFVANSVSASSAINLQNSGSIYHQISFTKSGTVATCQVEVDSSADGSSWNVADVIPSTLCTSNGDSLPQVHFVANFIRVNVTAISGGGTVTVVYTGYTTTSGGGGSGTVNAGTTGQFAYYAGNGTAVSGSGPITTNVLPKGNATTAFGNSLVSDDGTTLTYTGTGGVTSNGNGNQYTITQGTITTSKPAITQTATWNAAGVAFTNLIFNITCTASAANSIGLGLGVSGTTWQFVYKAANCAQPQLSLPAGINSSPSLYFGGDNSSGFYRNAANQLTFASSTTNIFSMIGTQVRTGSAGVYAFTASADSTASSDSGTSRCGAACVAVGNGTSGDSTGLIKVKTMATNTNCAATGSAANPSVAACGSASAGSFSCATNASGGTCTVNTTAVTAASEIFITQRSDTTTGTTLGVTCNTTLSTALPEITAVTAATSFTINLGTITTNPECFSYHIVN